LFAIERVFVLGVLLLAYRGGLFAKFTVMSNATRKSCSCEIARKFISNKSDFVVQCVSMKKSTLVLIVICVLMVASSGIYIAYLKGEQKKVSEELAAKAAQAESEAQMMRELVPELIIEDLEVGTGPEVKVGDTISIDYQGTLLDGTEFDSSYSRGEPFETVIGVGQVIQGWDEGVVGMQVGGKRKLTIPADMAYGEQARGSIPANSPLLFEVELKEIK
jgi:hypothetical protein